MSVECWAVAVRTTRARNASGTSFGMAASREDYNLHLRIEADNVRSQHTAPQSMHRELVFHLLCYLTIRFGPRSFRYATMSSTSSSVSTMRPPRDREPTGSSASVKLKNR